MFPFIFLKVFLFLFAYFSLLAPFINSLMIIIYFIVIVFIFCIFNIVSKIYFRFDSLFIFLITKWTFLLISQTFTIFSFSTEYSIHHSFRGEMFTVNYVFYLLRMFPQHNYIFIYLSHSQDLYD